MGASVNAIVRLEVCVDGVAGAAVAAESGADRIELCSALGIGGITPSLGAVRTALTMNIPVHVLVRPRGGGFRYSDAETGTMMEDIADFVAAGAAGLVIGALDSKNELDEILLRRLLGACDELPVTLHRAFDYARHQGDAMEQAIDLGFSRILTSGGQSDVMRGLAALQPLFEQAADRITIMPGGGITPTNLPKLLAALPLTEVHASCKRTIRNKASSEDCPGLLDDGTHVETCATTIRSILTTLRSA